MQFIKSPLAIQILFASSFLQNDLRSAMLDRVQHAGDLVHRYLGTHRFEETPAYYLDLSTLRIASLETSKIRSKLPRIMTLPGLWLWPTLRPIALPAGLHANPTAQQLSS
jgi:hypothetical protein